MSTKSLSGRLAAMFTVAVLVAGCGDNSSSDRTSQPASSSSSSTSTPSTSTSSGGASSGIIKGAEAKCLEALKKIPAGPAHQTGERACKAIKAQESSPLKAKLRKQCLAFAQQAPAGAVRKQAEAACAKL